MAHPTPPRLLGSPDRIFISVDESTGRATLSFAPPDVGTPIVIEEDPRGDRAVALARELAVTYPGAMVVGPHFHAVRGKPRPRRGPR